MAYQTIRYDVEAGVATLVLNRPERHNAFNLTMGRELRQLWHDVQRDPTVVCTILTGAGDKAFCTGMDVADVADGSATEAARLQREDGRSGTTVGDGLHPVGLLVRPGTYTAAEEDGCYWERQSGTGKALEGRFVAPGTRATVTVRSGDAAFLSAGCGEWKRA